MDRRTGALRSTLVAVAVTAFLGELASAQETPIPELQKCLDTIVPKDISTTLDFLTADDCAGRDTPQRGLYHAIEYIEAALKKAELEPIGTDGYRFEYSLDGYDAATDCLLTFPSAADAGQGGGSTLKLRDDFIPARQSASGEVEGELVFSGYGIEDHDFRWNDYSKVSVKGKIAIVLTGEPRQDKDEKKFFDGKEMTESSSLGKKAAVAAEKGAKALLVVAPTQKEADLWLGCQLPIVQREQMAPYQIPVAVVSGPALEKILGIKFVERRATLDARRASDSESLAPRRVKLRLGVSPRKLPVHELIARYPAADAAKRDEVVIIGSHLDHIGVDDRGRVYHGADDNGGGSAAVLEIAQALATAKPKLTRSIVLMWFTGEEKGLLGSHAYASNPSIPPAKMIAMINLDIISRGRPKAIEATQPKESTLLTKLLPTASRLSGASFKIGDGGKQFFERSDQFEFHKIGVPTVFFNEGVTNDDYHKWTDTEDKVLPNKVAGVAKIALALGCLAANSERSGERK